MLEKITSQATRWTKIHFKPPQKKEFSPEQKEEVLIAKSQPLQSRGSAVNPKTSIHQCNDDSLDFQFCKMLVDQY
jgi:hypothetical protein